MSNPKLLLLQEVKWLSLFTLVFIICGCDLNTAPRQAYFETASQAKNAWQQTEEAPTRFYGCGDNHYPCQAPNSFSSNKPLNSTKE